MQASGVPPVSTRAAFASTTVAARVGEPRSGAAHSLLSPEGSPVAAGTEVPSNTHLPFPGQMHAVHAQRDRGVSSAFAAAMQEGGPAASPAIGATGGDDPLMTHVAPLGTTVPYGGAAAGTGTWPLPGGAVPYGGAAGGMHGDSLLGAAASANVSSQPFNTARHHVYAGAPLDLPWPSPPGSAVLGASDTELAQVGGQEDVGSGQCGLSDEAFIDDMLTGRDAALWALQENLMLEEPP